MVASGKTARISKTPPIALIAFRSVLTYMSVLLSIFEIAG